MNGHGVKVSLFDVADAARPRQLASQVFGASGSSSVLDQTRQGLAMLVPMVSGRGLGHTGGTKAAP